MISSTANDLQRLFDRYAIQDAIYRWCRAVDRCDWELIRTVFHPDGQDCHGLYNGDVDGLIAWLTERHKTIPASNHCVTNILIEFDGDDLALVETYCIACQKYAAEGSATRDAISGGAATGNNPFDMIIFGRYIDQFERRGGEWKISRRVTVFDNPIMLDSSANTAQLGANMVVGRRNTDDPLQHLRLGLGLKYSHQ